MMILLTQLNNPLLIFLCHLLVFCRTAPCVCDIVDYEIRIFKQKFVAVIDSKSGRNGFNTIGQNGIYKVTQTSHIQNHPKGQKIG